MSLTWVLLTLTAVQGSAQARPGRPAADAAAPKGAVTAFVNVSVIPMDREQVLAGQTVLVRGSTIAEVGPVDQVKVPAGAARVDGQGKFLIPGLGDMHVHFFSSEEDGRLPDWYLEPRLSCYAANGVTTIRVMALDTSAKELTRRVAAGDIIGPRMAVVGMSDRFAGRNSGTFSQRFAAFKAAGYDFASVSWNRASQPSTLDSMAAAAREAGIRLAGDVPVVGGLDRALRTPYGSIEQLQGYLEQLLLVKPDGYLLSTLEFDSLVNITTGTPRLDQAKMAEITAATQRAGVWNVPAQAAAERMVKLWSGEAAAKSSLVLKIRRQVIKALRDAGAGLLLGTDAPTWGSDYGFAVHEELAALVASGLTPYQALETGTRNVAAFLGAHDSTGTVAAGKRADLVLLRGNPLEDIGNTAQPAGVMINGQWLPRAKLDARLKLEDCSGR